MAKNIGATLSLKDSGFKAGIKSASSQLGAFKKNTESSTSSLKKFGSQSDRTGSSLGSMAKKVAGAVAAYAGFNQVKDFLTDCVTGVMELERANTRLETLMMNVKGTTQAQVQEIIDYGDALELVTTIEGDATVAGASQLATFQMQASTIKTLMPAFQDLAVAQYGVNVSQEQMINSANLIGKVMQGQTGALTKAGVSFTEAQEKILKTGTESEKAATLVEVLGLNFGGLAQNMAKTDEGKIVQLKNAWGSVKDEVGYAVLPAVTGFVNYVSQHIPEIRTTVTNVMGVVSTVASNAFDMMKSAAEVVVPILVGVVQNWELVALAVAPVVAAIGTYKAIVGATNVMQNICNATLGLTNAQMGAMTFTELAAATGKGIHTAATGALTAAQTALNAAFLASPIGWIVVGIAAVVAAVIVLYKKSETFRNFVNGLFKNVVAWAKNAWAGIKASLQPVIQAITNAFKQAWELIKVVWNMVKPYFTMVWNNIKVVFSVVATYLGGMFNTAWTVIKAVWNTVTGYFKAIWDTIAGIFSVVKNVLTGNWSGAWEAIKGIVSSWAGYFSGIWESIKSIFGAVGSWFSSTFSAAWEGIKAIFGNVAGFFQGIWDTIKNMFTTIGTAIGDGISGAFKSVVNSVISFAGGLINGFINSINWAIGVINKIPGVNITKLQTVNLPMLAKGGNITRPGEVIVGERGPEILSLPQGARVTPLDKAGTTNHNDIHIEIHAADKTVEQIVNELVPRLELALSNL